MSKAYNKIVAGLKEAIAHAKLEHGQEGVPVCPSGKRPYATRSAAQIARAKVQKREGFSFRVNVFKCTQCPDFHLGRDRTTSKLSRKPIVKRL